MRKTLAEIAKMIGGEVFGDGDLIITGVSGIQEAKEGDITFLSSSKFVPFIQKTKASAIITSREIGISGKPIIFTDNPSLAFTELLAAVVEPVDHPFHGIHERAIIAKDAMIGKNVAIGPYVVVESGARVGEGTVIYAGSYIGCGTHIGQACLIYPNVTVREQARIGSRVIIHSGTVIGSDGFGFVQVNGVHKKIPQMGIVVIEDDVEVGSNVTIDRARFDRTVIGRGTKIDNLVQIAHNVIVGEDCLIVAQVGISGSVNIGRGAILAGQAGIAGHLTIGEGAVVLGQAGVTKSVPPREQVSGFPARPNREFRETFAYIQKFPEQFEKVKQLEKRVEELENLMRLRDGSTDRD